MNAGAYERDWFTKDGGRRRIIWTNAPLRHANGALRCFIGTGIDITDRRTAPCGSAAFPRHRGGHLTYNRRRFLREPG